MSNPLATVDYFPHVVQISAHHWRSLALEKLSHKMTERGIPPIIFYRQLALKINRMRPSASLIVHAGQINLFATLEKISRYIIDVVAENSSPGMLQEALLRAGYDPEGADVAATMERFVELFPPGEVLAGSDGNTWLKGQAAHTRQRLVLRELLLIYLASENPAIDSFREILDDAQLAATSPYSGIVAGLGECLARSPLIKEFKMPLLEVLRAPIKASPHSLSGQVEFIRELWAELLPPELLSEILVAFDILLEEEREWYSGDGGPATVMTFNSPAGAGPGYDMGSQGHHPGYDYPEYEAFSQDADWMSNVVMMAKMVYVWLDQLSRYHGYPITRLDQIPDAELDRLAAWGFTGLWLIGIWERSPASQRIKQICGNPEAIASAYSLFDYEIAPDLGGWDALHNLKARAARRGIRLASDMVPNHTGIYSRWVMQHPDWFVQTAYPPFPTYQFNGNDLSSADDVCIQIEDGYWTKTDAAVVFRFYDRRDGRVRYIYHGNDGTSIPWNDTAQLNYLIPEVREAVLKTILHVAHSFPIIRFDAAMTLAKKHFQRLWFPIRGLGGGIPSRAEQSMTREEFDAVFPVEFWREVVDRVAAEAPDTLLLAEAFWMMEGYFVRTLGMHRVYNSAFMNMLKTEENAHYRQTIKNVLEFNPEVLKRFVNFMNNPDEKTAVEQFGSEGKYFGACVLLATMPGLPMFGHGQIEGFREKYGMEYKRAYWNETVDEGMVRGHEMWIFPLLRRRWLFSGSENFVLYDFYTGLAVDENVFAYSNRAGSQCGLVLYHNSYASTAGWIRDSAAFAVKTGADEPELCRITLGEALGLKGEPGVYYAFHDQTEGLEYLRSGRELCERGLYAELGPYQFHIFMDFREIHDDNDGAWGHLCAALGGRGVEKLEDERTLMLHASLNEAFRELLDMAVAGDTSPLCAVVKDDKRLSIAMQRVISILSAQPDRLPGRPKGANLHDAISGLALAGQLPGITSTNSAIRSFRTAVDAALTDPCGIRLLLAWLTLCQAGGRVEDLASMGLECTFRRACDRARGTSAESRKAALLLAALLDEGEMFALSLSQGVGMATIMVKAFASSTCRDFMQVHVSEGVEWFNKERFEELCLWLSISALTRLAAMRPATRAVSTWMAETGQALVLLTENAMRAGYRTALFTKTAGTKIETGPSGKTKKGTGKDVSGGVRTRTQKKPNVKAPR